MPARPSRTAGASAYIKRAVPYHATAITVLWVVILFLTIGFAMVMLLQTARIIIMQRYLDAIVRQQIGIQQDLRNLHSTVDRLEAYYNKMVPPTATLPSAANAPAAGSTILVRGSASPDGTKYAGYDDVTAGKKGIGVQVTGETRVRHIVIFNTKVESSGAGTPDESALSVRWTDNQTIEYDVLVKKADGTTAKETRSVKIYF